jgi:hypothetical protein
LYAETELERALSEGWVIEIPEKSTDQSSVFSSFSFDMHSNFVNYLNPKYILYNKPSHISIIQTRYESDGTIKDIADDEEYRYSENTIQFSFESDSLIFDLTETYDKFGRRVEEVYKARETGDIFQHRVFIYDEENQMMFWYENGILKYILTEYKDQYKSVYIKYSMNTKYAKTDKHDTLTLFYNKDKTISKTEDISYITDSVSITTCEYTNGQITRLVWYNQSNDFIIQDMQYFYQDNRYIGSYDTVTKNRNQYGDFDTYGNWTTNSYYRDGILQGTYKRELYYSYPASAENSFLATVNDNAVRIREYPSLEGNIIGQLNRGMTATVIGRSQNRTPIEGNNSYWLKIRIDNIEGWAYGAYIDLNNAQYESLLVLSST